MDSNITSFPTPANQPGAAASAMPKLLKPADAAEVLQVDDRTLVRWARLGYVPAHPMGLGNGRRRMWRFYEHELITWANAQTNNMNIAIERVA